MSAMGWRVKAGALALFVAAVAVLAVVLGVGSGSSDAGSSATATHRALAGTEADRLLAAVTLPAGTAVMTTSASGIETGLLQGIGAPASPDVADSAQTWTSPESVAAVDTFLHGHPVAGTRLSEHGGSSDRAGVTSTDLVFADRSLPAGLAAGQISFALVPAGAHATIVHADAAVTWLVARPASEMVPAAAHVVDIVRGRPGHTAGIALTVTDPQLTAIRTLINRLPTVQPGSTSCPAQIPGLARVSFIFRTREGGPVLAAAAEDADVVAPTTACDPLDLSIGGSARTPLLDGAPLLREVSRIVHHRLWLAPYAA